MHTEAWKCCHLSEYAGTYGLIPLRKTVSNVYNKLSRIKNGKMLSGFPLTLGFGKVSEDPIDIEHSRYACHRLDKGDVKKIKPCWIS